ncbi:MAG: hypothetical protein HEP71_14700 [Roseivirga sp.]|nr:hypothetical protein [Roseivirga sp.]
MSKNKNHKSPLENPKLKEPVFQVPADYFDELEDKIMGAICAEESKLTTNDSLKESIFEVPEGYFNQLEERIEDGIRAETGELASNDHLKENIFRAPQGYFNSLDKRIAAKLEEESSAKVIPLYQRNWFRAAVAAMLVIGIFLFLPKGGEVIPPELSEDLMLEYLYEEQDMAYELMALSEGFDDIIDNILFDETSVFDFSAGANLELEYDFEYFEQ